MVPQDWEPRTKTGGKAAAKYPIKTVNEIYRIRLADDSEWLKSRQMWKGLDKAGNEIDISMNDKEMYDSARAMYVLKAENPKDRDSPIIRTVDRVDKEIKYTLPFSAKEAQKLWDMKDGACNLVIVNKSGAGDHPPVTVPSFEHFKSTPFQELWEMLTTPKFKMDRSYGDNLDNSHIG